MIFKQKLTQNQKINQPLDRVLLSLTWLLVSFGLIMVYSASFIYAHEKMGDGFFFIQKQVFYSIFGSLVLLIVSRIPYTLWDRWAYGILGLAIGLLALTLIPGLGERVGGARRWIQWNGYRFQPGEFAKFAVIFFVARQLHRKQDRLNSMTGGILAYFLVPLPVMLLLLMQPDFGTPMILAGVIFILLFVAGVPIRYLLTTLLGVGALGAWLVIGTGYRRARLLAFLNPWDDPSGKGFQILQSLLGLHQGSLIGVGLGNGKEKLFYLPEAHNDFIFSVIGEELGFLGIFILIFSYIYLIYRGLRIAWNAQNLNQDRFAMLLATGITLALGLQGFVNMAVVLGLLPTKGLTLPLISYGGSALVVDLFAIGVLLNISRFYNMERKS